jgi:hypothetical protein
MATLVKPYPMRSTVSLEGGELRISVPTKKSWAILFILVWLALWTVGGVDTGSRLLHEFEFGAFLWTCFWLVAECGATYLLLRMLFGRDVIVAKAAEFSLSKQILGIGFAKAYLVPEMRDLRFQPEAGVGKRRRDSRIVFDYGAKTIGFAEEIEEAEAAELIQQIKGRCQISQSSAPTESGIKFWKQDKPKALYLHAKLDIPDGHHFPQESPYRHHWRSARR